MSDPESLVCAYRFDGQGGAEEIGWERIDAPPPPGGFVWVHLNRMAEASRTWLRARSGLEPLIVEALLIEDTRPRFTRLPGGALLNLRGVNGNPGAHPEDMLSVRIWLAPERVVSARRYPMRAVQDIRAAIAAGRGPTTPGELAVLIADGLVGRMEPVIRELDDETDRLEEAVMSEAQTRLRTEIARVRRQAIVLRRHIGPQREALGQILREAEAGFSEVDRRRLGELADRITRFVEELDAIRERALVVQDELVSRAAEDMNRTMYLLSIVAAIFLPLGLITGVLGVNVAGIPGADTPWAFAALCLGLVLLGALEFALIRRLGWI
jgi:zinc transporter